MKKYFLIIMMAIYSTAYGQSFTVYGVDLTNFPRVKANLYVTDASGNQVTNLSLSEFRVIEDGINRTVTNLSCPTPKEPEAISSVLTIDVSGSMDFGGLDIAKAAAKAWVDLLPLGKSECAITSFDDNNYLNQDFTTNKTRLLNAINSLVPAAGTDFNAGLYNLQAGSLQITKTAKHKKVVVFLTDGDPNLIPDIDKIVNEANSQNCVIYSVVIGMSCPECLKEISERTGGFWYDNVYSDDDAKNIYKTILLNAQGTDPCTIEWLSDYYCSIKKIQTNVLYTTKNLSETINYITPKNAISKLSFTPNSIYFKNAKPRVKKDTTLVVTANNQSFNVTNVTSTNPAFSVVPTNFSLSAGQSITLTVSFTPTDSSYNYTKFIFENNRCETKYYSTGGFFGFKPGEKTLKITHPNGGEKFLVGSDTIITWEGILETDTIQLQLSIDDGNTWNNLTNKASNLKYIWKNIPKPASNNCLIKATQYQGVISSDNVPSIIWEKNYGGTDEETAYNIQNTNDGGFILIGETRSSNVDISILKGFCDIWLVKLDNEGIIQWEKTYGGSDEDHGVSVQQTTDNGFIFIGYSASADQDIDSCEGTWDFFIVKTDEIGEIQWKKTYGGNSLDFAKSIEQTSDGGYIVGGYSDSDNGEVGGTNGFSDFYILKLRPNGDIEWKKKFGGQSEDLLEAIHVTTDNGFIAVGHSFSDSDDFPDNEGEGDIWVLKLDPSGNILWKKHIAGTLNDIGADIKQTSDGGYIICGNSNSGDGDFPGNHGQSDCSIIKLTSNGDIEWFKNYGGTNVDWATSIVQTTDGGYVVGGSTASDDYDVTDIHSAMTDDFWILKLNSSGEIVWTKCLGGTDMDVCNSILEAPDGNIVAAGFTTSVDGDIENSKGVSDIWVVKLSSESQVLQSDISDSLFAIVEPKAESKDIDMGKVLVGAVKDSIVNPFITNIGAFDIRIDDIYFTGTDASAFSQVSMFPPYQISSGASKAAELRFIPNRIGIHKAVINILTQSGLIKYNIQGEGVDVQLKVLTKVLDFGKVELGNEKTFVDTAVIKNVSNSSVTVVRVTQLGPDYTQFVILNGDGSFILAPNEERLMTIKFKPINGGRTTGQIGFEYNGYGSPVKAQLFGTGIGGAVKIADDSAYAGEKRILKMVLSQIDPAGLSELAPNFEATIRFQSSVLAPSTDYNWYLSFDSVYVDIKGTIGTSYDIAQIPVTAALGTVDKTQVEIVKFVLKDNLGNPYEYNMDTISGEFKVLGICNEGGKRLFYPSGKTEFLSIIPNPADKQITITINTVEIGETTLSIINTLGEELISKNISSIGTGQKEITLNTSELPNGVYYLKLQTPTTNTFEKLIINR